MGPLDSSQQINNIHQDLGVGVPGYTNHSIPSDQFQGSAPQAQQAQQAYVDPYAQWGGQNAYNNLRSGFGTQKSNIYGTSREAAQNAGIGYNSSILDLIESTGKGQRAINSQGVQNELAKKQGTAGVLGMINRGVKSGGVMLANKNASDSSASGALAKAYGELGRQQLSGVGNQYAKGNMAIQDAQVDLESQRATGVRKLGESKQTIVNGIVSEARNQLASLDAQIANASLPDRINIEQEKEAIRQEALGQLQNYDNTLTQGMAGITASSIDDRRSKAREMAMAGDAPESAFQYTEQAPAQWGGTGPFASNLPLFTFGRGKKV